MKIAIMQPYFFPYIGYWQLMNAVDVFVIYDDVNYINRGWINRNRILLNNKTTYINLPLIKSSQNKKINEIEIDLKSDLFEKNIRKIYQAYHKAPFFDCVFDDLKRVLLTDSKNVCDYLNESFDFICGYLNINTKRIFSSEIQKNNLLKGEEKIIEICKRLNADIYINAIGGMHLYKRENFVKEDLELRFINSKEIYYKQYNDTFVDNLSIIDMIMFNSREQISKYLYNFEEI